MNIENMRDDHLESVLHELKRQHPSLDDLLRKFRMFIGGSFVRSAASFNEQPSDIDLFIGSSDINDILSIFDGCRKSESKNSIHFYPSKKHIPINVITRWTYDTADAIINDTDFSVCQNVVYFDRIARKYVGVVGEYYYRDIADGRARYMMRSDVPAPFSIIRLAKLSNSGYKGIADDYAQAIGGLMRSCNDKMSDPYWVSKHLYGEMLEALNGERACAADYKPHDGGKQRDPSEDRKHHGNDRIGGDKGIGSS